MSTDDLEEYMLETKDVKYVKFCPVQNMHIYKGTFRDKPILFQIRPVIDEDFNQLMVGSVGVHLNKNDRMQRFLTGLNTKCDFFVIYPVKVDDMKRLNYGLKKRTLETYETYASTIAPRVAKSHVRWIDNIISGRSEQKKIIHKDDEFILLPDPKWASGTVSDIYCLAVVTDSSLKSIRDLTDKHIPLLQNIYTKGLQALKDRYNIDEDAFRVYVHYHPSYWHLHVHFNLVKNIVVKSSIGVAHSVLSIIENLKVDGNYYQKVSLEIVK